jgi:phosphoglycolate phosphatase
MDKITKKMADFYCDNLEDENRGHVLPGVNELLSELNNHEVYLGLVTGNIEQIAHHKIFQIGVEHSFEFGGFGNEDWDRSVFMKNAIEKAIELYDLDPEEAYLNSYYIGDTPHDVAAAKKTGVHSIIVCTGFYDAKDFMDNEPDLIIERFDILEEKQKFLDFIGVNSS